MLGMPSLLVGMGPLPPKALADLPPPASLPTGTQYEVTDYGGNAAIVINGVWRFVAPFRTTWANRPPVNLVPVGAELQATDYNNQTWICDGTYWRPAQGRVVLKELHGLIAVGSQLAQLSGVSSGLFTIPGGCKIPAGMVIPHSRLFVQTDGFKAGANGQANFTVQLGTSNSLSDVSICTQSLTSASGVNSVISCAARFGTATDRFNSRNWQGEGATGGSYNSMNDRVGFANTNADMFLNLGVTGGNALDVFNLVSLQVVLEA